MNIPNWFTIQSENPKNISQTDLKKIYEIEQDMWAEWIWEYTKCPWCWKIHSKKDIFGHLSNDIYKETVSKIEQIISINLTKCKNCGSNTEHIWWEQYIDQIKERYNDEESFLTTLRTHKWEIIWFADAYINDFDTVYEREFDFYYSDLGLKKIKETIWKKINFKIPEKVLMHSTTWIEAKYTSLNLFITLLKDFYLHLKNHSYNDLLWIYEASIWSIPHSIYHISGAKRIWITENNESSLIVKNVSKDNKSDIFVHPNIIKSFVKALDVPIKNFVRLNSIKMKEVLIR